MEMEYKNIYTEKRVEAGKELKKYGWTTTVRTKPLVVDALISVFRECPENIKSRSTLEEMSAFIRDDDGKMNAAVGQYDDRVMSLAIAQQVKNENPLATRHTNPFSMAHKERQRTQQGWAAYS